MSAIILENVQKIFPRYSNPVLGPVLSSIPFLQRNTSSDFHVLKDISFKINKGEVVGIVGSNGAGKTTLLKIIAGMLSPTAGKITVNGRITVLLAMGVGINIEFTGRENILYSGMLLGMKRKEVIAKMQDIIDFSELGSYIDQPVRTYSSGMRARLLFSISSSIQPEILIVDEALATGDAYFVEKAMSRIKKVCQSGATVLFVSHNLNQISKLCSRAILLSNGRIVEDSKPEDVLSKYNQLNLKAQEKLVIEGRTPIPSNYLAERITLENISFSDESSKDLYTLYYGNKTTLNITINSKISGDFDLFVGFLKLPNLEYVAEFNTVGFIRPGEGIKEEKIAIKEGENTIAIDFSYLNSLNGHYSLWIIIYTGGEYLFEGKGLHRFFVTRKNNSHMVSDAFYSLSAESIKCHPHKPS